MNNSRLTITLQSERAAKYNNAYHHKLRGRIWRALENTKYEQVHDEPKPLGITFSGIVPYGDISKGDYRRLEIGATNEDVLIKIAESLQRNPEFNIGEMSFVVDGMEAKRVDVGPPGTTGTLVTNTGVLTTIPSDRCAEFGIQTPDSDKDHYWRGDDPLTAFQKRTRETLETRWQAIDVTPHGPSPAELYEPLFDTWEFLKDYSVPLTVTTDTTFPVVLSKWKLGYTVQSDAHRKVLNFALQTGLGRKTEYGLGNLKLDEVNAPTEDTTAGETTISPSAI